MVNPNELIFDVVTRSALLVQHGQIHLLDGPFDSKEQAELAAAELKKQLAETDHDDLEDQ